MSACVHAVCKAMDAEPCTPESISSCCDKEGNFLTTATSCYIPMPGYEKPQLGYCKTGTCVPHDCKYVLSGKPLTLFCGASDFNPCKAKCSDEFSNECYDTAFFSDSRDYLEDGAICLKDRQKGVFGSLCFCDIVTIA